MLVLNDVKHDGRVRREASALAAVGWRVLVIGTQRADAPLPDWEHLLGFDLLRVRYARFGAGLWRPWRWIRHALQARQLVDVLRHHSARIYHAHDLPALILLTLARREQATIVYDSHELFLFQPPYHSKVLETWHRLTRPLFVTLEKWLARRADAVITVSEPHARCLRRWYRIAQPLVIQNCIDPPESSTEYSEIRPREWSFCLVHTGDLVTRGRNLRELVAALGLLPDSTGLVFLGAGEARSELAAQVRALGINHRITFAPPVPPEQVAGTIQEADAAVVLLSTDSWHIQTTLPNKLFEAIAAGLPVVASDTFALRRIVSQYNLGILCDPADPAAIASAVSRIFEPHTHYQSSVKAAQSVLNWQVEAEKLRALYRQWLT